MIVAIFTIVNFNYINLIYFIDSTYIYILNQLINLNLNLIIVFSFISFFLLNFNFLWFNANIYIYIYLLFDYSNQIYLFKDNYYNLNINLINGLFLIHPILIYIYYVILCIKFIYLCSKYIYSRPNNNIKFVKLIIYTDFFWLSTYLLYIIFIAIFLGSWWAYQELSWGTWWNWDSIEIINLIYFLFSLAAIHKSVLFYLKNNFILFIKSTYLIFFLYLIIRYSIIQSIHNFLNVELQNQYNIYILVYIYLFTYLFKFTSKKYITIYTRSNYINIFYFLLITSFITNLLFSLYFFSYSHFLINLKFILLSIIYIYTYFYIINLVNLNYTKIIYPISIYFLELYYTIYIYLGTKNLKHLKYTHFNFYIIIFFIINYYFTYKLTLQFNFKKENYFIFVIDNNFILNFIELNALKFNYYIQSLFYINLNFNNDLNLYSSYSTQLSDVNYLLPNWLEINSNKNNKYLFLYIFNLFNTFLCIILNRFLKKKIRKIYF